MRNSTMFLFITCIIILFCGSVVFAVEIQGCTSRFVNKEVGKDEVEIIKSVTSLESTNPFCSVQCDIYCHVEKGCNAATCDPQVGYCHLGYYKGLDNVSLTHQNLSKDEIASFHLMEDSKCKELSIYYINIQGCFLEDTGRNGGRNFGTFTNVISEYQCQRICQENEECEYFVYKKSKLECKLTSESASPVKRVGHLFGPKYC